MALDDDLAGTPCTVDDCIDPSRVVGVLTVELPALVGAVEDNLTLGLPLCGYHAHLLRMGGNSFELDSRE